MKQLFLVAALLIGAATVVLSLFFLEQTRRLPFGALTILAGMLVLFAIQELGEVKQ